MSSELHLPLNLPFPIRIVSLDARPPASVPRGSRLLSYSFAHTAAVSDVSPETRFGTWDSPIDGTLDTWKVKAGELITLKRAREKAAVVITEPCTHESQIAGMCTLCGKDMTIVDYTGFSDAQRATIAMTHAANGPLVSLKEAQRLERETADHLLKSRRLSLIVDLDQTIVHATVDPTVGDWIAEGEAWEARRNKRAKGAQTLKDTEGEEESDSSSDSEDEDDLNPNWEALKDVAKFRLAPESLTPHTRISSKGKGRAQFEDEGHLYYIKPRPGWKDFLNNMAIKYEMHVYTMGTRAYAEEVCAAIDPDKKIFGRRILSRDESGSLTQKSLQRLFPCDTSMVVIIDDRADVWEWSPNLVKVIPYDFFVGIGDINSTFLPKLNPLSSLPGPKPPALSDSPSAANIPPSQSPSPPPLSSASPSPSSPNEITLVEAPSPVDEAVRQAAQDALLTQNTLILEAQLEERPLAKMQEELSEKGSVNGDTETTPLASGGSDPKAAADATPVAQATAEAPKKEKPMKKALLTNNDAELSRVQMLLDQVHGTFYDAYDAQEKRSSSSRRKSVAVSHDVRQIIPRIRMDTLRGVHIVFSSVIPLDMKPESTEIWRTAYAFGAECGTDLTNRTTHVVAAKRGTAKVDAARRRGGIKIVWLSWFTDSIALWRRQDERPYLLDEPVTPVAGPSSSPTNESSQIGSSDLDLDTDDWEEEDGEPDAGDADAATGTSKETPLASGTTTPAKPELLTNEVAWEDIDAEVEAAMNESDTEDIGSERGEDEGMRSANASDDEGTDGSATSEQSKSSNTKRKRLRSLTPSEASAVLNGAHDDDVLRSPLAKRKRVAAERTGASKLKHGVSARDLHAGNATPSRTPERKADSPHGSTGSQSTDGDGDGDGDDEEEDDELEDFLAHELGEDWG